MLATVQSVKRTDYREQEVTDILIAPLAQRMTRKT